MPIRLVLDEEQIEQLRERARTMAIGMGKAGQQYYLHQIAVEHGFGCWRELVKYEKEDEEVGTTTDIVRKVRSGRLVNSIFAHAQLVA